MEVVALAIVLVAAGPALRLLLGLPLLARLAYRALTSLPMGRVPGRPAGSKQLRHNVDLRARVAGFLNEVRSVEAYAQRAMVAGLPRAEIDEDLRKAQRDLMSAAAEVVKVIGRAPPPPTTDAGGPARVKILTHGEPLGSFAASPVQVTRGLRGAR